MRSPVEVAQESDLSFEIVIGGVRFLVEIGYQKNERGLLLC
jgi:hypothetical protein